MKKNEQEDEERNFYHRFDAVVREVADEKLLRLSISSLAHEITIQLSSDDGSLVSFLADIDSSRNSGGFRPRRNINGVAEQAVARHSMSNHSRHDLARMNADGDSLGSEKEKLKDINDNNCTTLDSQSAHFPF